MPTWIKSPCDKGVIESAPASAPCRESVGAWVLAATIIGSSIVFIDGAVVNVALPVLQKELGASISGVQWVVEAYSLFLAALILVGGSLGDHYGRRKVFALGIAVFGIASVCCGLSPSVGFLIASRSVQGIGGALLVPGSLALISTSFSEERRGQAIGMWSGFTSIASGLGPVLGGWLVGHFSWRWAFFINVPLVLIVLAILFSRVPESRDEQSAKSLDLSGAATATIGLGAVVYALVESGNYGLTNPFILVVLSFGLLVFLGFIFIESRSASPMMPLWLFRSRTFTGTNLLTLMLYAALSGLLFFLPFNLIQVQGYSTTEAGAALVPFIVIMFLLSRWAGGLINKYGAKIPLIIGPVIVAIGFGLFCRPSIGGSYWTTFFPAIVAVGLGMAISVAPLTTTVMNSVAVQHSGIASGINNAVSRTAGLLSIALLSIVMLNSYSANLDRRMAQLNMPDNIRTQMNQQRVNLAATEVPAEASPAERAALTQAVDESYISGFRLVMIVAAALALCGALCSLMLIEGKPRRSVSPNSTNL